MNVKVKQNVSDCHKWLQAQSSVLSSSAAYLVTRRFSILSSAVLVCMWVYGAIITALLYCLCWQRVNDTYQCVADV